jgi:hypothetical protein
VWHSGATRVGGVGDSHTPEGCAPQPPLHAPNRAHHLASCVRACCCVHSSSECVQLMTAAPSAQVCLAWGCLCVVLTAKVLLGCRWTRRSYAGMCVTQGV